MFLIDTPGNVNGMFVEEDVPTARPPTPVSAEWLNMHQLEKKAVLDAVGIVMDKANNAQLLTAIHFLINNEVNELAQALPGVLQALQDLADAMGGDENFATTVMNALASKQPLHANLTSLSALSAINLGPVTQISRTSLPVENIGPIIVAGGDGVWEWSESAYYTGYKHPRCGEPNFGITAAPRPFEIVAVGDVFNKSDYPQLWGFAQEEGLVVSQTQFNNEPGAFWFVNVSGTQFRVPNLLGPNGWGMFPSWAAGGTDADTGNARAFGSGKLDTLKNHNHPASTTSAGGHTHSLSGRRKSSGNGNLFAGNNLIFGNDDVGANGDTGSAGGHSHPVTVGQVGAAVTAPRHVAFYPRIHI